MQIETPDQIPQWPSIAMKVTHDEGRYVTVRAAFRYYDGMYYWHDRVFLKNSHPPVDRIEREFKIYFQFWMNHWGI